MSKVRFLERNFMKFSELFENNISRNDTYGHYFEKIDKLQFYIKTQTLSGHIFKRS